MDMKRRQLVRAVSGIGAAITLPGLLAGPAATAAWAQDGEYLLVDPTQDISSWKSEGSRPRPDWKNTKVDGLDVISVTARASVGILHRPISVDVTQHPVLSWSWSASTLPQGADLKSEEADDVGAGLALVFGEVGLFKQHPPMLIYIWAASADDRGQIVTCIRHPETMRMVVIENGRTPLGQWRDENRNVVDDYKSAFGAPPASPVRSVALWADSDQTGGETVAAFGAARLQRS